MANTGKRKFSRVVAATDVVIFTVKDKKLQALLIEMKKRPYRGYWALPGGMVKPEESVDAAARRHLKEKAGVDNVHLEQLYTFGEVDRDPFGRVVSVAYFALVPYDDLTLETTAEYAGIDWFAVDGLPGLAYDHRQVLETAVVRLRSKLEYTNIAYSLLPREFTLSELQEVYEIILGRKLDKRNFRKKIQAIGLVKPTSKQATGRANRPARLYRFKNRRPEVIEVL